MTRRPLAPRPGARPGAPSSRAAARVLETWAAGTEPRVPGGSEPGSWVPHSVGAFLPQGRKPQAPLWPGRPDAACAGGQTEGATLSPRAAASRAPARGPAKSSGPQFPAAPGPRSPRSGGAVGGLGRRQGRGLPTLIGRRLDAPVCSARGAWQTYPISLARFPEIGGRLPREVWLELCSLWIGEGEGTTS